MIQRKTRHAFVLTVLALLVTSSWIAAFAISASDSSALEAFRSIRLAEDAGADVSSLIRDYNTLLEADSSTSFGGLLDRAGAVREDASSRTTIRNAILVVSVIAVPMVLSLGAALLRRFHVNLERERLLDREIQLK